jgi:hypothetical protein
MMVKLREMRRIADLDRPISPEHSFPFVIGAGSAEIHSGRSLTAGETAKRNFPEFSTSTAPLEVKAAGHAVCLRNNLRGASLIPKKSPDFDLEV